MCNECFGSWHTLNCMVIFQHSLHIFTRETAFIKFIFINNFPLHFITVRYYKIWLVRKRCTKISLCKGRGNTNILIRTLSRLSISLWLSWRAGEVTSKPPESLEIWDMFRGVSQFMKTHYQLFSFGLHEEWSKQAMSVPKMFFPWEVWGGPVKPMEGRHDGCSNLGCFFWVIQNGW